MCLTCVLRVQYVVYITSKIHSSIPIFSRNKIVWKRLGDNLLPIRHHDRTCQILRKKQLYMCENSLSWSTAKKVANGKIGSEIRIHSHQKEIFKFEIGYSIFLPFTFFYERVFICRRFGAPPLLSAWRVFTLVFGWFWKDKMWTDWLTHSTLVTHSLSSFPSLQFCHKYDYSVLFCTTKKEEHEGGVKVGKKGRRHFRHSTSTSTKSTHKT